jgi:hypothetical protein
MRNLQKGFANVTIIAVILIFAGAIGYWTLGKSQSEQQENVISSTLVDTQGVNSNTSSNSFPQGASYVSEEGRIQVSYPKGGEVLEIGKTYDIKWSNYVGNEPLTITLQVTTPDNKTSTKLITSNAPATGSYKWTVTSESLNNKYKIEINPTGGRELFGRSKDFFTVTGDPLITVVSPQAHARVNASQPLVITGKAKQVFGEGEFDVTTSYVLDGKKQIITHGIATCSIVGNGCDWTSGNLLDFKATLDLSKSPVCFVNVEFFKRDERTPQVNPFFTLPLWLYGINDCQ